MQRQEEIELHVGNLPYHAHAMVVKKFFDEHTSSLVACRIATRQCDLLDGYVLTQSRGYGTVRVACSYAAEELIRKANQGQLWMDNRRIRVATPRNPSDRQPRMKAAVYDCAALEVAQWTGATQLHQMQLLSVEQPRDINFHVQFDRRMLHIELVMPQWYSQDCSSNDDLKHCDDNGFYNNPGKWQGPTKFRLVLQLRDLKAVEVDTWSQQMVLLLTLRNLPRVYRRLPPASMGGFVANWEMDPEDDWDRAVDFTSAQVLKQCNAYRLVCSPTVTRGEVEALLQRFADYGLSTSHAWKRPLHVIVRRGEACGVSEEDLEEHNFYRETPELARCALQLPFSVSFSLEALLRYGTLSVHNHSMPFFEQLGCLQEDHAVSVLQSMGAYSEIFDPVAVLQEACNMWAGVSAYVTCPRVDQLVWVRKVWVTPLTMYYGGPELDESNRIPREYAHIDRFLRVQFTDENFYSLHSMALTTRNGFTSVGKRVKRFLEDGIWIHGRHYEVLAFSSSQLREGAVWFFAGIANLTAAVLRSRMGDFTSIKIPAKYAARMGQCFSTTYKVCCMEPADYATMPDIKRHSPINGVEYCFTDGVGQVSPAFLREAVSRKDPRLLSGKPSALQIRFGGYKGVVITLLKTLGVEDNVFIDLQRDMVCKLELALKDRHKCRKLLSTSGVGSGAMAVAEAMLAAGAGLHEPLLQAMLQAFRASQLKELQLKSRILVPNGVLLMGVADEYGVLQPGEVFLQPFNPDADVTVAPVQGDVIVTRNPCVHPGDVRVLTAVDHPVLRQAELCNIVVFSVHGDRPKFTEMAGGDLDGDLYMCLWDSRLMPALRNTATLDYQHKPPTEVVGEVTIAHVAEFFVNFMTHDNLGSIANSWLALADRRPDRAFDFECMQLAQLHSAAVDSVKSGEIVTLPPHLRAKKFPDWMQKDDKPTYVSKTVIGTLWREPRAKEEEATTAAEDTTKEIVVDSTLVVPGYQEYLEEANKLLKHYNNRLKGIMKHYGIKLEGEILSGHILQLSHYYRRKLGEVKERVKLQVAELRRDLRNKFAEGLKDDPWYANAPFAEAVKAKASAWYVAAYKSAMQTTIKNKKGQVKRPLLSFPWCVYDVLCAIISDTCESSDKGEGHS
eukprot:jgi/Chlat1/7500/Chrsp61S00550